MDIKTEIVALYLLYYVVLLTIKEITQQQQHQQQGQGKEETSVSNSKLKNGIGVFFMGGNECRKSMFASAGRNLWNIDQEAITFLLSI